MTQYEVYVREPSQHGKRKKVQLGIFRDYDRAFDEVLKHESKCYHEGHADCALPWIEVVDIGGEQ